MRPDEGTHAADGVPPTTTDTCLGREPRPSRAHSELVVSDAGGVRFVDSLPEQPSGPALQQAVLGSGHQLAEEFRFLAAKVAALAVTPCTTIGVVSAGPREGKTTVALGLAAALARSSPQRVLLLEADLRQPAIEQSLGLPQQPRRRRVALWARPGACRSGRSRPRASP